MLRAVISVGGELYGGRQGCDVLIQYGGLNNEDPVEFYITLIEAKKTIILDYGLSICEEREGGPAAIASPPSDNESGHILVNGVEIPVRSSLTSEDLVKLIIDIYESTGVVHPRFTVPIAVHDNHVFGNGAIAFA